MQAFLGSIALAGGIFLNIQSGLETAILTAHTARVISES
jgi:hypothetical protein